MTLESPTFAEIAAALICPTRRKILTSIQNGWRSAGEISTSLKISRARVSRHTLILRRAGLVWAVYEGRRVLLHSVYADFAFVTLRVEPASVPSRCATPTEQDEAIVTQMMRSE
jgi:DNA-binding transcriptional ArsR family regulator